MNSLLLIGIFAISAAGANDCVVSEWDDWTEWTQATHDNSTFSQPAEPYDPYEEDIGRLRMKFMAGVKSAQVEYRKQCLASGACPELEARKSSGYIPCVNGFINDTYPCWNIDQQAFMNFDDLYVDRSDDRTPQGNDIWGWYDSVEGEEYAIMGTTSGVSFVRVTNPNDPVTVAYVKSQISTPITWRDMKTVGDFVYIVSENLDHGIQVFDLKRLRGRTTPDYLLPDTVYDRVGNCHNIVANEATNFVYGVGCTFGNRTEYELCRGGLHAVDVSDPYNPQFAGCFGRDGYTHDAQCVVYAGPDADYQGREVCFCYNEDTFTIVDVEDKANMFVISKSNYSTAMYTHQGWVTEDHTVALLDDELDEYLRNETNGGLTKTYLWDIKDLDSPVLMNTYTAPFTSIDHNQYIIGDITYQANYESGLRIMRIDQTAFTLTELAYFDVFPPRTTSLFFGSWSVYPWLPSRNLVVSSIDYGLFVMRPDYTIIDNPLVDVRQLSERSRHRDILEAKVVDSCPHLEQIERDVN